MIRDLTLAAALLACLASGCLYVTSDGETRGLNDGLIGVKYSCTECGGDPYARCDDDEGIAEWVDSRWDAVRCPVACEAVEPIFVCVIGGAK